MSSSDTGSSTPSTSSHISPTDVKIIAITVVIAVLLIVCLVVLYFIDRRTRRRIQQASEHRVQQGRGVRRNDADESAVTQTQTNSVTPLVGGAATKFASLLPTCGNSEPNSRRPSTSKIESTTDSGIMLVVPPQADGNNGQDSRRPSTSTIHLNSPQETSPPTLNPAPAVNSEQKEASAGQRDRAGPTSSFPFPVPPIPPTPPDYDHGDRRHQRSASTYTYQSRARTPELRVQIKVLQREMETLRTEKQQMLALQEEIARLKAEQRQVGSLQNEVESLRQDHDRMEGLQMEVERLRRHQDRMDILQEEVERLREEQREMLWELQNIPPPDYVDRREELDYSPVSRPLPVTGPTGNWV